MPQPFAERSPSELIAFGYFGFAQPAVYLVKMQANLTTLRRAGSSGNRSSHCPTSCILAVVQQA